MWSPVFDSAMRLVVIVLLDPTSDADPRFLQAAILGRPDFLFLQAAMESFDVAVALGVMIGRAPMLDAQPREGFQKARRSELRAVVRGERYARFAAALGSRARTACSTAASASSVRQRCERFQPTISRVQQSMTLTR